jgi:UDP-N-acetylglucosamine transferase subunit ALG13
VLVASGGGHLQQLWSLLPRLGLDSDIIWATPRTALSDGLLTGHQHHVLPYTRPRDWAGAARLTYQAHEMLRHYHATRIISTGASPAPPFFLAGASLGLELHYIESATRSTGPSLSGALIEKLPSAHLYSQYPHWATGRWHYAGSIFDPFRAAGSPHASHAIRRIVVTLGTEGFGFRRALERLVRIVPRGAEVLWQTGTTDTAGLGIDARPSVPAPELREAITEADVVVCHAGTGSALTAFELGKYPLVLPREARHGEHVDDHQSLTARELARRGLALAVRVDRLSSNDLERARGTVVLRDTIERPFELIRASSGTHGRSSRRQRASQLRPTGLRPTG